MRYRVILSDKLELNQFTILEKEGLFSFDEMQEILLIAKARKVYKVFTDIRVYKKKSFLDRIKIILGIKSQYDFMSWRRFSETIIEK